MSEVTIGQWHREAPGLWRLPLPMRSDPGHINSWLIADGDGWCIVDTGVRGDPGREAWRAFMGSTQYGAGIKRIVLTHAHPDHAGNAAWLAEQTGASVWMAAEEFRVLEAFCIADAQRDREIGDWLSARGANEEQIQWTRMFYRHFAEGSPLVKTDVHFLQTGDSLTIDGRRWDLHAGYGHTPCNLLMHQREEGWLITGDQVLPDIITHVGLWWRQAENPLSDYLASLETLRQLPVTRAFPAHGDSFSGFSERCDAIARTHDQRLGRLRRTLARGPVPLERLLKKFGGAMVQGPGFPLVAGQIQARINYLVSKGEAVIEHDDNGEPVVRLFEH